MSTGSITSKERRSRRNALVRISIVVACLCGIAGGMSATRALLVASTDSVHNVLKQNTYTVTYEGNPPADQLAMNVPDSQTKYERIDLTLSNTVPACGTHLFTSWNDAQDGSGQSYEPSSIYQQDSDITLYAQWKTKGHTVSFDMQGHGTQVPSQDVDHGSCATKPDNPSESNWSFEGWYEEAACTTAFNFNTPITADKTLYAKWIRTYTVTYYDGYSATTSTKVVETQTFKKGSSVTLIDGSSLSHTGYVLEGADAIGSTKVWNTAQDGSGTSYAAGATYSKNANLVLYAQWERYVFTVDALDYEGIYDSFPHTGEVELASAKRTHKNSSTTETLSLTEGSDYSFTFGSTAKKCTVDSASVLLDDNNGDLGSKNPTCWTNTCTGNTVYWKITFSNSTLSSNFAAYASNTFTGTYLVTIEQGAFMRLAGYSRDETAEQVDTQIMQGDTGGTLVIATSTSPVDVLIAQSIASTLTTTGKDANGNKKTVKSALGYTTEGFTVAPTQGLEQLAEGYQPSAVICVGGSTICSEFKSTLRTASGNSSLSFTHLNGSNRYDTAALAYAFGLGQASSYASKKWNCGSGVSMWGNTVAMVNTADDWVDGFLALSGQTGVPIIPASDEDDDLETYMANRGVPMVSSGKTIKAKSCGVENLIVYGYNSAVSEEDAAVFTTSAVTVTKKTSTKKNRYSTIFSNVKSIYSKNGSSSIASLGIASDTLLSDGSISTKGFSDAIVGSNLCATKGSLCILIPASNDTDNAAIREEMLDWIKDHASEINRGYIFGGTATGHLSYAEERTLDKTIGRDFYSFSIGGVGEHNIDDAFLTDYYAFRYDYNGYIESKLMENPLTHCRSAEKTTHYITTALTVNLTKKKDVTIRLIANSYTYACSETSTSSGDYACIFTDEACTNCVWTNNPKGKTLFGSSCTVGKNKKKEQSYTFTSQSSGKHVYYIRYYRNSKGTTSQTKGYNDSLKFRVYFGS